MKIFLHYLEFRKNFFEIFVSNIYIIDVISGLSIYQKLFEKSKVYSGVPIARKKNGHSHDSISNIN